MIDDYTDQYFSTKSKECKYLTKINPKTVPVTNELIYKYDSGDGWVVRIRLEDIYTKNEQCTNSKKQAITLTNELDKVIDKLVPVCIEKDGIELLDDIGGISGFCSMLKTIYQCDDNDPEAVEEMEGMLGWARAMGWTSRNISPEKTL